MECTCNINGNCDGDFYEETESKIFTHNLQSVKIKCGECGREINIGEDVEWYRGNYGGDIYVYHTCIDCLSLRDNFFGNWTFEYIWQDFKNEMEECGWKVSEKCLSKLTPTARAKVCKMIEQYWGEE